MTHYAVIGAAGIQARGTVLDLLEFGDADDRLLLLDLDEDAVRRRAEEFDDPRVSSGSFDVLDHAGSVRALDGVDLMIAASPSPTFPRAMEIAIDARCHYVDMGSDYRSSRAQMERADAARDAGVVALLSSGSAPGLSNMMAKAAVDRLDTIHSIDITVVMNDLTPRSSPFHWPFALDAIIDEYTLPAGRIVDGAEQSVPPRTGEWVEFPEPIGRVFPIYTTHPEQYTLFDTYRERGLKNTSFRIALPRQFHEKMNFLAEIGVAAQDPVSVNGVPVTPKEFLLAVTRGLPRGNEQEQQFSGTRVEVSGERGGSVRHYVVDMVTGSHARWNVPAGMLKTCVPPAIMAQMIAAGSIATPGVWMPEETVDVSEFFTELARRGMAVAIEEKEMLHRIHSGK